MHYIHAKINQIISNKQKGILKGKKKALVRKLWITICTLPKSLLSTMQNDILCGVKVNYSKL